MPPGLRRTSHEVRGLKPGFPVPPPPGRRSHLTRGAWIETICPVECKYRRPSRTSHEVRGLKPGASRGPGPRAGSHLTRGAWIETMMHGSRSGSFMQSHLTRGAWIETSGFWLHRFSVSGHTSHEVRGLKLKKLACIMRKNMSHLTRGAWIETTWNIYSDMPENVAPHTRCVD